MKRRVAILCFALVSLAASARLTAAAQNAPPGIPTNVQALVAPNGSTLTVSWNGPHEGAASTAYRLDFYAGTVAVYVVQTAVANSIVLAVPAGVQGQYSVTVQAIANTVAGQASNAVSFVLGGSGPCTGPPSPPARLRFTRVGTRLDLLWDESFGATEYVIEAGSAQRATDIFVGSVGTATSFGATIPESTHAFVRVRARNTCGVSLFGDEIEIGAMWGLAFRPGLDIDPCLAPGQNADGGLCSQVLVLRGAVNQFDEIWSPATPVMRARGAMTPSQVTATLGCFNGAASGTLQATWDGVRYVGTATLGGATTNVRITPGNFDPQCEIR